jgi:hypothetical protein
VLGASGKLQLSAKFGNLTLGEQSNIGEARTTFLMQLNSSICNQSQLESEIFQAWVVRMFDRPGFMHRKLWEWAFIAQALRERNLLHSGAKGLGFAVGAEPLSDLFASEGCTILATDLDQSDKKSKNWMESKQHAGSLEQLAARHICAPDSFRQLVSFRCMDMNSIPSDVRDYDFLWSSSSLEHLGSLGRGKDFIIKAMDCLRPGGVAVHTTEFNLSSNFLTVPFGPLVLYRRRDIESLAKRLRSLGHSIDLDFTLGTGPADTYVDLRPYKQEVHLRLNVRGFVLTSIGLIITKKA